MNSEQVEGFHRYPIDLCYANDKHVKKKGRITSWKNLDWKENETAIGTFMEFKLYLCKNILYGLSSVWRLVPTAESISLTFICNYFTEITNTS